MSRISEIIKVVTANALGLFVYGELGDIDSKRGVTTKHTLAQQRRFSFIKKLITRINVWLLKVSRGRVGNSFLGRPVLLLTTIGRKSGQPRSQPLFYVQEGENIYLVASNGGDPKDPVWLINARENPAVTVTRNGVAQPYSFRVVDAAEKAELWPRLTEIFPYWQEVSDRSHRDFPVVVLEPVLETASDAGYESK